MSDTERLQALLSVVQNHPSPFYREKYAKAGFEISSIKTAGDISRIPFVTRKELALCPLWDRAYLPHEELLMCGYTSGTTSGDLFPVFRNFYIGEAPDIKSKNLLMISLQPWRAITQAEWFRRKNIFLVSGDLQNPPVIAAVSARVGIDAMYCTPTIAQLLALHLQKVYDLSRITTLVLHGERISDSLRKILLSLYPRAMIRTHYASSEAGSISLSCPGSPNEELFHCDPNFLYETVDEEGNTAEAGELILTTLEMTGTPLIRYRTGDAAEFLSEPCTCEKRRRIFKLTGRIGYDAVKVGGLELKVSSFEKGIIGLENRIDAGGVEVHVFEDKEKARPFLEFRIPTHSSLDKTGQEEIAQYLKTTIKLAPNISLADLEARGLLEPSRFIFLLAAERKLLPQKRAMLVSHLS